MSKLKWIIALVLLAASVAALIHGIKTGDAGKVFQNADNFCFG